MSITRLTLFIALACVAACGGSNPQVSGDQDMSGTTNQDLPMTNQDLAGADLVGAVADQAKQTIADLTTVQSNADLTPVMNGGSDAGVKCGATTCAPGKVCCATKAIDGGIDGTCADSCAADGGITVGCLGPQNCDPTTAQYCCATVEQGAGSPSFPQCKNNGTVTQCLATCNTNIMFMCNSEQIIRICRTGADCADDTSSPNCCDFSGLGRGCVSNLIKGFLQTQTPPSKCY